jgi:uncharacterized damage-inducible protein DinB
MGGAIVVERDSTAHAWRAPSAADDPTVRSRLIGLQSAREGLRHAVEVVPADAREQRLGEERWSVAEILEHLSLVEGSVTRLLGRLAADPGAADLPGNVISLDLAALVDRSRPIAAIDSTLPSGALTWRQAWDELTDRRRELLRLVTSVDGIVLHRVRAPHSVFGLLDGVDWIRFVEGHEARHTAQILEIARGAHRR